MLNRTEAPAFQQKFSFELPKPEIISLSKYLDLVFLPGLQQEVFKLEIVYKAAKWHEPKIGVSHFTATLLDKGTAKRSSKNIADLLDYFGAQIEISPGYDFTSVSLYGLKKYFKETFSLFLEIIKEPIFPHDELEIQKKIFIQNLKINNEKNSFIASKLIRKNIFGANHPYGSSIEESDVVNLAADQLHDFFKSNFLPHEIYLIGNLDGEQTKWISQNLDFNFTASSEKEIAAIESTPSKQVVQKAESVQSSIRLGQRTINRNHKDYFSLLLLNHVLGGYFGSRLMKNIREKKGLTYGIYSSINPFKNDAMFSVGADVSKDKSELALMEIKREIECLMNEVIPQEEFTLAKNHFLGSLELEMANPFSSFEKIKNLRLNRLDSNYYVELIHSVKTDRADRVREIAKKYFSLTNFSEILVG